MASHRHAWVLSQFVNDPDHYNSLVEDRCSCGKTKKRYATDKERDVERARLTCDTCGMKKEEHNTNLVNPCIALLVCRIRRLEERLDNASISF